MGSQYSLHPLCVSQGLLDKKRKSLSETQLQLLGSWLARTSDRPEKGSVTEESEGPPAMAETQ